MMPRFIAFLLAAAIAACAGGSPQHVATAPSTAAIAPAPVRVMTFNIRYGTARDGNHIWPLRRPLVFRAISDYAPTVLGVQEALRFQLDEIGRELAHYDEIGVGRDDGREAGEYSAVLYDKRRLEVLAQGTFWLSDTPEVPGSMTWGNRYPRIATWARFRDVAEPRATFYVFNTHWDHESQVARERGAALIIERIRGRAAPGDPVLLIGDFNAGPDNAAIEMLNELELFDTYLPLHPAAHEIGTYHAFRGDRTGPKIDAILASPGWVVLGAGIVWLVEDGRYPSDHFPVTSTLLPPPGQ